MFPQQQHITTYFRCQVKITVDNGCQVWEDYDMENTSTSSVETQSLPFCPLEESGVTNARQHDTVCADCGVAFARKGRQRFCSSPCRQRSYRKGFSHALQLQGKKNQRLNRRNHWAGQRMRDKSFMENLAHLCGPEPSHKIPLGALTLKSFSKEAS